MKVNREIELARNFLMHTNANIFLTGKAGTGKTTFLHEVVKQIDKRVVVAAPTGIAALNAGGVTLHSLFMLPFTPYIINQPHFEEGRKRFQRISKIKKELFKSLDLLVIDEISMVRCDMLDAVDDVLRRERRINRPFGGVQLLLIGDIQQLAPVCKDDDWEILKNHYQSPYFFDSKAFRDANIVNIELQEIFRQNDTYFTNILNAIRENRVTNELASEINKRYLPDFEPPREEGYITLTTHVHKAQSINSKHLCELESETMLYPAEVNGTFIESSYPNDTNLELKVGARVMFIKNGKIDERNYYNGMMATITALSETSATVIPKDSDEEMVVSPIQWENKEYQLNSESGEIDEKIIGTFTQLPLKCAWAITIHKSQGLTFDKVIIDVDRAFAHGQSYVAFSRCRTLEGIVLLSPFAPSAIIRNQQVEQFNDYVVDNQGNESDIEHHKREYYKSMVVDIFDYSGMMKNLYTLQSFANFNLKASYPQFCEELNQQIVMLEDEVSEVSIRFKQQAERLINNSDDYINDTLIKERLYKAANYFKSKLDYFKSVEEQLKLLNVDTKELEKKIKLFRTNINGDLGYKVGYLDSCCSGDGITVELYRKIRLGAIIADKKDKESTKKVKVSLNDIEHSELYNSLCEWRRSIGEEIGKPLFTVMSNKTLLNIVATLPCSIDALKSVSGIGKQKLCQYGDDIIDIVDDYCKSNNITPSSIQYTILEDRNKPTTNEISYQMYKDGATVEAIALERGLKESTIVHHLSLYISSGELDVNEFISPDKLELIASKIEHYDGTLSSLKEVLGEDISYNDIKVYLASIG